MRIFILTYFLAGCFSVLSQTDQTVLMVEANFEFIKDEQRLINGVVYDGSKYHSLKQGKLLTKMEPGWYDLEITVQIPANDQNWKINYPQFQIKKGDTTKLEITIPDNLMWSVAKIAFVPDSGRYYPKKIADTLNCRDDKGRKQGLWFDSKSNLGNCIDELDATYRCYFSDVLRYEIIFHFDYNLCVSSDHKLSVIRYMNDGKTPDVGYYYLIKSDMTVGSAPGVSSGFDHNQCSHSDMKEMLKEFCAADFKNVHPSFLDRKQLDGAGRKFKDGILGEPIKF